MHSIQGDGHKLMGNRVLTHVLGRCSSMCASPIGFNDGGAGVVIMIRLGTADVENKLDYSLQGLLFVMSITQTSEMDRTPLLLAQTYQLRYSRHA
jgi:hypothetical protein